MKTKKSIWTQSALLFLLVLLFAASAVSVKPLRAFAEAAEDVQDTEEDDPADIEEEDTEAYTEDKAELPEVYDPRPDGTSKVREQIWGTCWAQAGISSFESYLIRHELEDSDFQLSVEDVLWWAQNSWVMRSRNDGGRPATITGYLTTVGGRSEEDIPYLTVSSEEDEDDEDQEENGEDPEGGDEDDFLEYYGMGANQLPENYDTAPVLYEVTDMIFLKNAEPEEIKSLIMKYGAVSSMFHDSEELFNEETSAFRDVYEEEKEANHSVSVIGWDDHFPKESFIEIDGQLPENDGAWIVKNSYGTEYGSDGGFIYISYEDGYLFKEKDPQDYSYCISGAREPEDLKRYLTDESGAVGVLELPEEETGVFANVYEFGEDEELCEVSFVTWTKGGTYQVYYAPVTEGVPDVDEASWELLSEGDIEYAGYMTVSCEWDAPVPEGKGAIVVVITGETPSIGTEEPLFRFGRRSLYNPKYNEGTAFMLKDGAFTAAEVERALDEDFTYMEKPDLSIRAYTKKR